MTQQILIAGNQEGLNQYLEPFLLPTGAYPQLENAYIFRQRAIKKKGYERLGRLRRCFTASSLGNSAVSVWNFNFFPTLVPAITEPNAELEAGSVIITIGVIVFTDDGAGNLVSATPGNSGTINYATGAISLTHTAGAGIPTTADFCYFPSLPVMGLLSREQITTNFEQTIGFDTTYAYRYVGTLPATGNWEPLPEVAPALTTWTGSDSDFFSYLNWRGASVGTDLFYVSNFNGGPLGDPIRYYNGAVPSWTDFTPLFVGAPGLFPKLQTARLMFSFKGRMVLFNVWEEESAGTFINYRQRARWSQVGDPLQVDAWRDDIDGKGDFLDASTKESIIGAEIIKDRLIVYFERSTWEFVYNGVDPFIWRQINSELGEESSFSTVIFDDAILGIGNVGIHACNAVSVQRIDQPIINEVFKIQNGNDGIKRVYGIRDYFNELVYWTFPSQQDYANIDVATQIYPNRVIVFNYRENSWAEFIESFTCYGYFQKAGNYTWSTIPYPTWETWTEPWNSGVLQERVPQICAGNQQGFTFVFDQSSSNEYSRSVTAIAGSTFTSPNHNLVEDDYVIFRNLNGITLPNVVYKVDSVIDANQFTIDGSPTGTYAGGGEFKVLSNFRIKSKRFNPFYEKASSVRIHYIDFFLSNTERGEVTINIYPNEYDNIPAPYLFGTSGLLTSPNPFKPGQLYQNKIWQRKHVQVEAQNIQVEITLSDEQMRDLTRSEENFEMHAMMLTVHESGRII